MKGSGFETLNAYTTRYSGGLYTYDVQHTVTPLDGIYESYENRETSTYDADDHTAANIDVSFDTQHSYLVFTSYDDATGASVTAYDSRSFYYAGFYEYNTSFYSGPGGYSQQVYGSYHYNG